MHKDVLETIVKMETRRILTSECITADDVADVLLASKELSYLQIEEMAERAVEFGKRVIDKQDTIRIYDLFLRNHGLEEEFDNFYIRILRRKYKTREGYFE